MVSSGLGRAHVFMSQSHYQEQFRSILGTTAWPGTLNITVETEDLVLDDSCEWEVVEELRELLPYVGVTVLSQAFIIESVPTQIGHV